jgi:signal transduction histidine kinase
MHAGEKIPIDWVKRYPMLISFALSLLLVALGVRNFLITYPLQGGPAPVFITAGLGSYARAAFFSTFFFFIAIFTALLVLAHLSKDQGWIGLFLIIATICLIVATYSLHDYLEVKLPLVIALLITAGLRLGFPLNLMLSSLTASVVILFQYSRTLFGESIIAFEHAVGQPRALAVFSLVTITCAALAILLRRASDALSYERAMLNHQQNVMTQLSIFNQRLQEQAKEIGEEAAQQERNRISREMHDSSGYVFTNIMALIDAAISGGGRDWSKLEDLLQTASIQARDGLQETRRTLRALRKIEPSLFSSIDSIYQIARIFSETTHIEVQVEIGNMERDYGQYINRTLCRIVQEALTNAIRHGRASKVMIQFWVSHGSLCMIVSDNGVGSKQVVKGIGLAGMEERLAPLEGSIQTSTPEEGGFRLTIYIPLQRIPVSDDINTMLLKTRPEVVHVQP